MRALLDVNVLIALLDSDHTLHARATKWFSSYGQRGWSSCPLTQNGCMRIMSHPSYPNTLPVRSLVERLAEASATEFHQFWPDDVSLLDPRRVDAGRIHGPRQLTDLYLLALAVKHKGRLVTFDAAISVVAVVGAQARHLLTL